MFDKGIAHDVFKRELIDGAELVGTYELPRLRATHGLPRNLVPFNAAMTEKHPEDKWVHFFIDDYQFERLWTTPYKYLPILRRFAGVITPDHSMRIDMPKAQQIWNCYRNRTLAYWMQREGLSIVPTVEWARYDDLDWCLDGLPNGGVIAVGEYGCMDSGIKQYGLLKGIVRICRDLSPYTLVLYGKRLPGLDGLNIPVVNFETYCTKLKKGV